MEKSFYIIEVINKNVQKIFMALFISFFPLMLLSNYIRTLNDKIGLVMQILSIAMLFLTGIVHLLRSFVVKDYKKIGTIKFDLDGIVIEIDSQRLNFRYNEINDIVFVYGGYKGKMSGSTHNFYSCDGSKNSISFNHLLLSYKYQYLVPNLRSEKFICQYIDELIIRGNQISIDNFDNEIKPQNVYRPPSLKGR